MFEELVAQALNVKKETLLGLVHSNRHVIEGILGGILKARRAR